MSVEIVIGRSSSGKSEKCINDAKQLYLQGKQVYIIVPDQFSHKSEKKLLQKIDAVSENTLCAMTFKRLCDRVFEKSGYARYRTLSKSGKNMIAMRSVYLEKKNLVLYKRSADSVGFSKKMCDMISELKRYGVDENMLYAAEKNTNEPLLKSKLSDIARIYARYNSLISDSYTDSEDNLYTCAALLTKTDYLSGTNIFFDEFSDFLPSHYAILEVILKRAENVKFFICADEKDDNSAFFEDASKTVSRIKDLCYRFGLDLKITHLKDNLRHKNNPELFEIEKNYTAFKFKPYEKECKNVSIFESNSAYEELEYICAKITYLVREKGYRYSDICVSIGDVESYKEAAGLVFDFYDIPFFISDKKSVDENPMVITLLSAIDIFINGFEYEDVFLYLKSGFSNLSGEEIDILENYVLAAGIKKNQWLSDDDWNAENSPLKDDEIFIYKDIDNIRRKAVSPLINLREKIGSKNSVKEAAAAVFEFMCEINMAQKTQNIIDGFKKDGRIFNANVYAKTYNAILNVLDQCVLIAGGDKIGIKQFKNMLAAGFSAENSAFIPQTVDEIYICSVSDARAAGCKVMFCAGTNTGEFVLSGGAEGVLSDDERAVLQNNNIELAPSLKTKVSQARCGIYKVISKPEDLLYLSCSLADFDSNAAQASALCQKIRKILKNVKTYDNFDLSKAYEYKYAKEYPAYLNLCSAIAKYRGGEQIEPVWHSVYNYLSKKDNYKDKIDLMMRAADYKNVSVRLDKSVTDVLYKNDVSASASRLERYRSCPFSYFIEYTLKAKERKILKIGSADIGSIMHAILEKFVKVCVETKLSWNDLNEQQIRSLLLNITNEYFSNVFKRSFLNTKSNSYLFGRLEKNLVRCALLITQHMKRGKFEPVECEVKFGGANKLSAAVIDITSGKKLKINGIIDRLDKYEDESGTYFRVVDYKSGSKNFSLGKLVYGLDLQLALYLHVALENNKNSKPAAMLYFKIAEPLISAKSTLSKEQADSEIAKKMKMDGIVLAEDNIIKALDENISSKSDIIPVSYNKDGSFKSGCGAVTQKEFEIIFKHIKKQMKQIGADILNGKCDISPCLYENMAPCRYCKYSSVCRFDKKGGKYNTLEKLSMEQAELKLNQMYGKESEDGNKLD